MYFNFVKWVLVLSFLYCLNMFAYTNISAESFIFSIESFYLCILIITLRSFYHIALDIPVVYLNYLRIHFYNMYVYSNILKKLNLKVSIIYRCFH